MSSNKKILTFVSYYYPGYKAGGPIRTISNLVENLGKELDFYIVSRDRDLGDSKPYYDNNSSSQSWLAVGFSKVLYLPARLLSVIKFLNSIDFKGFDVLYLNSVFDFKFSIIPLIFQRLGLLGGIPVVLAPRGEFSSSALRLKGRKKSVFIKLARLSNLYKGVIWQVSSNHEKADLLKSGLSINNEDVFIAKDLPTLYKSVAHSSHSVERCPDAKKVIFLSRISPMKNLDYALDVLKHVSAKLQFDIYGPKEDYEYWLSCERKIDELPSNVTVRYMGLVRPDIVCETFTMYDLFFLPSRGENYAHVIAESLIAGTPVLISDQTPWQDLKNKSLGWDLSLDNPSDFVDILDSSLRVDSDRRILNIERAKEEVISQDDIQANMDLFRYALQRVVKKN